MNLIVYNIIALISPFIYTMEVSDILNAEYLPSTLILESNKSPLKNLSNVSVKDNKSQRKNDGDIKMAYQTMLFHRSHINDYMCRNYVANEILQTVAQGRLGLPAGTKKKNGPANSLMTDEGSEAYQNWLERTIMIDDIYKHFYNQDTPEETSFDFDSDERDDDTSGNGEYEDDDDDDEHELESGEVTGFAVQESGQNSIFNLQNHGAGNNHFGGNSNNDNAWNGNNGQLLNNEVWNGGSTPNNNGLWNSGSTSNTNGLWNSGSTPNTNGLWNSNSNNNNGQWNTGTSDNHNNGNNGGNTWTSNMDNTWSNSNSGGNVWTSNSGGNTGNNWEHNNAGDQSSINKFRYGGAGGERGGPNVEVIDPWGSGGGWAATGGSGWSGGGGNDWDSGGWDDGKGKGMALKQLFDLALTALAVLAFKLFIINLLLMCFFQSQTTIMMPTTATGTGTGTGTGRGRDKRDILEDEEEHVNYIAYRVITGLDKIIELRESNTAESKRRAENCLQHALCSNNKLSRKLDGKQRILLPIWSFAVSWMAGGNRLGNLRASILGLGAGSCNYLFPNCTISNYKGQ